METHILDRASQLSIDNANLANCVWTHHPNLQFRFGQIKNHLMVPNYVNTQQSIGFAEALSINFM
ncbi:hypothetical protein C7B77_28240 [Chamaesiphon polymorphus CCALA 037]|uniref:Uncharacterized protein n=1 Tax=Chamaesiphon polymorphus CCALA 037 TaxID=2107692 RepID=A0A2T1F6C3_9CYAN|nr:hypothetical protein C7B77_28240 [Chamaesiphon polymorphus CCALA 037]